MKKNKLALAAGILLIIVASISILCAVSTVSDLIPLVSTPMEYTEESLELELIMAFTMIVSFVFLIVYILQSVGFMIVGIKLVKRCRQEFTQIKKLMIVSLVFSSVGILFNIDTIMCLLLIAVIVLLACGLARGTNYAKVEEVINTSDDENKQSSNDQQVEVNEKTEIDALVEKAKVLKDLKDKNIISEAEFNKMIEKTLGINAKKIQKTKGEKHED